MAIKQPLINMEEQLAGLRRLTAKPVPARIFLSKATDHKQARATLVRGDNKPGHATPVHADNSQAPAIVPVAAETVRVVAETVAEEIGLAIAAHLPAQVPREVPLAADRPG